MSCHSDKEKALTDKLWSFTSINTYYECPFCFKLKYIDNVTQKQNAFSEWGLLCHKILEGYYKDDYSMFELEDRYLFNYPIYMKSRFPYNAYSDLSRMYFESGREYFSEFYDEFMDYNIVGIEQEINTNIGKYSLVGYIDLILEKEGNYIICDHKSKSKFKSTVELKHYLHQLYLYSKYIYEHYSKYPKALVFNMFRAKDMVCVNFDKEDYLKSLSWAETTIEQAINDDNYYDKIFLNCLREGRDLEEYMKTDYFCNNICSVRESCKRSREYNREDGDRNTNRYKYN